MKILVKNIWILVMLLGAGSMLWAGGSVTFLSDGRIFNGTIIDMSSNTGILDYRDGTKINRNEIWMISYESGEWDFPDERNQLSGRTDTVFLKNGQVLTGRLIDFSSRRFVWEFQGGDEIQEAAIARIYFCCSKLPKAYNSSNKGGHTNSNSKRYAAVFLLDGNYIEMPLKYLNNRKTGFTDGLQINTKDIWMINLEDDNWDFPDERQDLDTGNDSIFTAEGEVFYDTVVSFDEQTGQFQFKDSDPMNESEISRIYFCCEKYPDAYRNINKRGSKRGIKNR